MIQIGFSTRRKNILSRIIRFFTHSEVSHVWLIVDELGEGQVVMEAGNSGFVEVPWDQFLADGNDIVAVCNPKVPLDKGVAEAHQWLGEKYDVDGLIGMAWVMIGRWFKAKWHNPFNDSHELFCSEAIAKVLQISGYPGTENMDPSSTSPQDLYELVTKNP